jgi:predicted transcriptional regulator
MDVLGRLAEFNGRSRSAEVRQAVDAHIAAASRELLNDSGRAGDAATGRFASDPEERAAGVQA